ncbi:peptidoglycan DD-metalloendopeptidase family protein [Curtobacterium sp. ODYSSEY 48 V2]|uniref:peptidoglycan DD-metalloendopeptidase family protein n=1 Tax=Curtobacterium sp. ODYSSEY 48 V2 TaxID=2939561 RepID=UPI0020415CA0|nr:peptidoglycan DD-metalloendopeptidase family protein [Curtobacterium sp. ODYSSEY 48 V2]MCM3504415.1 peptidoglycan DD-metalloendopeptidase family protein [Curtobacterium sp. ODYSSEY 48 V2]
MPHASTTAQTPTRTETEPVVHLTRRARIEAERRAAATSTPRSAAAPQSPVDVPSFDELVAPTTPAAPVSPIDLAPASPVRPAPSAGAVTPPAPVSPDVAPAADASRAPTPVVDAVRPSGARRPATAPTSGGKAPEAGRGRARRTAAAVRVDRATRHISSASASSVSTGSTRGDAFRRNASRVTAVGALLFAAGLVVSTSLPAQALWVPPADTTAARATGGAQSLSVGNGAVEAETTRDQYSVTSATQYKNVDASSFSNDPNGSIQWPFLTGVPITSGFGGRQVEGCSFCSTNHMGVDFAPGEGTPIRSVAAGTVIKVQAHDGGFGNDVWVQHDVDGKQFVSVYGHMKDGTFKVVTGQEVAVGDELGEVGSTGNSTGPHLHLEIHVGGVPVDPLTWLRANAN